jgi:peptide/nickel transport system substrate-binding protein
MMRRIVVILLVLGLAFAGWTGEAEQPRKGGRLIMGMGVEPESLDTIGMHSAPAAMVSQHITEMLFDMSVEGELIPVLATGYEVSPDGLVWTIYLRKGVKFHDGTPFNAEAVKFNLDRFLDPEMKAVYRFLIVRITEVEVVDEYTVKLHLDEPFAPLLAHLSHSFIGMLSPKAVEELGEAIAENPVGTGPFKMKEWIRGEHIILERNEEYWGGAPYLDEVMFRFIPEDAARVVALEAGEVHTIMRVPPMDVPRLEADPDIRVLHVPSVRTIFIAMNNQKEPFGDARVRQAINYCVNKEEIVEFVLAGAGRVSDAPFSPGLFGYHPFEPYEFNPEIAKALLAAAGYPDGFKTTLHHPTGRYLMDVAIAEAVQAHLREFCRIEAELITMEWAAYLAELRKPPEESVHNMALLGWGCITYDADYCLYPMFNSGQWPPVGWAISFYKNEAVDELLDTARVTPDLERRRALYKGAVRLIWYDAPWLWLHSEVQINAELEGVHGLIHHPRERIFAPPEAWIEE